VASPIHIVDEFPFTFYGETFAVALASDRKLYVPLPLVCSALGLSAHGQIERARRDPAISDALLSLEFKHYPYGKEEMRPRQVNCLRLDRLPYWLGTIDANRISNAQRRQAVIRFKREFADVAWAAFRKQILPDEVLAEMDAQLPPGQQAYFRAMDQAAELRRGLENHGRRIDDVEERLTGLEARFEGTDFIHPEQGRRYQLMVNFLAMVLKQKGKSSGQALVHNEVKRAFKVPSYLLIPEARFPEVVRFLAQWYQRLTPPGTPLPEAFALPDQKRLL